MKPFIENGAPNILKNEEAQDLAIDRYFAADETLPSNAERLLSLARNRPHALDLGLPVFQQIPGIDPETSIFAQKIRG